MNKLIVFFLVTIFSISTVFSQQFKTHAVKEGETVESIAKLYKIKPADVLRLNPEIKGPLKENMILVIPPSLEEDRITPITTIKQNVTFKKHKVRKRETLYSISNKYDVTIDDIKRYNKELYSRELKKGERIRIPKFAKPQIAEEIDTIPNGLEKYIVKPKQGKWRIAYEHGITVKELEGINPEMGEMLDEGQEIWVPIKALEEKNAVVDSLYNYYTVKPKEGFFRLKVKLGLSEEEIRSLNPELQNGELLRSGMIIKIPKDEEDTKFDVKDGLIVEKFSLLDSIQFERTSNIALIMPFRLNKVDADSVEGIKMQLKRNSLLSRSVDFYSGALMAIDSAKQLGLSTNVKVYDSERNVNMISNIIANNDFENVDAVIGPFFTEPFNTMSRELMRSNTPIFAPFSKSVQLNSNVFQTLPSDEVLYERMVKYLDKILTDKNVIIIADSLSMGTMDKLLVRYPSAKTKTLLDKQFLRLTELQPLLDLEGENYVIVETKSISLLANITSVLNSAMRITLEEGDEREVKEVDIKMVTTNRNSAYDSGNISNLDLSNLKFQYPTISRFSSTNSDFSIRYEKKYNALPSKYAVRGFDITMDVLLRLAYKKDLFYGAGLISETEYIENKFNYSEGVFGGYTNTATYIARYDNLEIKLVKEDDIESNL
ncbi:LysM peptidoglycan-binding domain-containing protein [Flavobacteriaceae bacterium R38]|nr:LysM peptidoglycan-binding domain-containing protein [Flavobacteriaceae bacterium R38]